MGRLSALLSCLLLTVGMVTAQTARQADGRLLPQWLTGIIAVVAFLFLTFVVFLVNKAWCQTPSKHTSVEAESHDFATSNGSTYDSRLEPLRSSKSLNTYDNLAVDIHEDKVTAM